MDKFIKEVYEEGLIRQKIYRDGVLVEDRVIPDYSLPSTYDFSQERNELRFN